MISSKVNKDQAWPGRKANAGAGKLACRRRNDLPTIKKKNVGSSSARSRDGGPASRTGTRFSA